MTLAPYPGRGHKEHSADTHPAEMIACQEGDLGKRPLVVKGERQGVGGHDGAHCRAEDCNERQDPEDHVPFPQGPVLYANRQSRPSHAFSFVQIHTKGSLGSSLGCGTRRMGTGPERSYFNHDAAGSVGAPLRSSSRMCEVPNSWIWNGQFRSQRTPRSQSPSHLERAPVFCPPALPAPSRLTGNSHRCSLRSLFCPSGDFTLGS
jgi:hypothetical protein